MSDYNYPPTRTYRLGESLDDAIQHIADLEDSDDADPAALQEAATARDGLRWLVSGDGDPDGFGGFGRGAEIVVSAYTARERGQTLDTARAKTMGDLGPERLRVWLIAGALEAAPWLDTGDDLRTRYEATGELPPAVLDWLDSELEDINTLGVTEGN